MTTYTYTAFQFLDPEGDPVPGNIQQTEIIVTVANGASGFTYDVLPSVDPGPLPEVQINAPDVVGLATAGGQILTDADTEIGQVTWADGTTQILSFDLYLGAGNPANTELFIVLGGAAINSVADFLRAASTLTNESGISTGPFAPGQTIGFAQIASLAGTGEDDSATGTDQGDLISTGDGNDDIAGGEGNDTLVGGPGDDTVDGGSGNDQIWAGFGDQGNDSLSGGDGNDTMGGSAGDDTIFGGAGNDILFGGADDDLLNAGTGNNTVWSGTGNDTVFVGVEDDTLGGGEGDDRLYAGGGDDLVFGANGADSVIGDSGNDTLFGGAGNDTITGGDGNDEMYAGDGNDLFLFGLGHGDDSIGGFETRGDNMIDLSALNLSGSEALGLSQVGADVLIDTGHGTITLWNTSLDDIDDLDFVF